MVMWGNVFVCAMYMRETMTMTDMLWQSVAMNNQEPTQEKLTVNLLQFSYIFSSYCSGLAYSLNLENK